MLKTDHVRGCPILHEKVTCTLLYLIYIVTLKQGRKITVW